MAKRKQRAGIGLALGLALALAPAEAWPQASSAAIPAAAPHTVAQAPGHAEPSAPALGGIAAPEPSNPVLDLARQTAERVVEAARGQNLQLGLGYVQNTAKFGQFPDLPPGGVQAEITDNGRFAPYIQYSSPEKEFASYPMQTGRIAFGYNVFVTYETFDLNRQLIDSPFVGKDLDTRLQGDYLAAAPLVFMRLGPLYPGRDIYWKVGAGIGAALLRYHGEVVATKGDVTQRETVSYNAESLSLFETAVWELQIDRWVVIFKGRYVEGGAAHNSFTVEQWGLTLAYTFTF